MIEGISISTVAGTDSGVSVLKSSNLRSIESKYLNIKNNLDFIDSLSVQFSIDLQPQPALLPLQLPGQILPLDLASGTKLPPEMLEKLATLLSEPGKAEQLGLDKAQLNSLKNALQNAIATGDLRLPSDLVKKPDDHFGRSKLTTNSALVIDGTDSQSLKDTFSEFANLLGTSKNRFDRSIQLPNQAQLFAVNTINTSTEPLIKVDSPPLITPLNTNLSTNSSALQNTSYSQTVSVDTMLARPQWAETFNSKVMLLAQGQKQIAHIQINPAELGPVEIRLSVNNDHTSIHFISQHNAVREAIEDAFPRLREMMSQSGINLGDVNVSQHSSSDQQSLEFENTHFQTENSSVNDDTHEGHNADIVQVNVQKGLIDQYI